MGRDTAAARLHTGLACTDGNPKAHPPGMTRGLQAVARHRLWPPQPRPIPSRPLPG